MSIFQGEAPPNVTTTKTSTPNAPSYYTDYLSSLANAGTANLGKTPDQLVAGFSPLQQQAFGNINTAANSYLPQLTSAQGTAAQAAQGITGAGIERYLNPYTSNVVNEMGRLNQQNLQQNLLPSLKAGFVGTGAGGSQRNAGALAQVLAMNQANLTGEQGKQLSTGFTTALGAANQNAQILNQAAQVQGALADQQQRQALGANKAVMDVGAQQQALEQAKINAPLTNATNVAQLMRGYTIPTATTETYNGPAQNYGPSPLSQIAGLGSLLASGFNSSSGWGPQLTGLLGKWLSSASSQNPFGTTSVSDQSGGESPYGGQWINGEWVPD
jgi:hypothetical protein